jgi:hypothetical protein
VEGATGDRKEKKTNSVGRIEVEKASGPELRHGLRHFMGFLMLGFL